MPSGEVLTGLTEEQLHSLEGMERANVEARIELLRNIQRLLDSAVTQLNQYSAVMATLGGWVLVPMCMCSTGTVHTSYTYLYHG